MRPSLIVSDVTFGYRKELPILKNIDLELYQGEVTYILGANGCGKSTLLQTILGMNKISKGTVTISGRNVYEMNETEIARKIGIVFQEHSAPFPFQVLDVVKMGRAPYLRSFNSPSREDTAIAEKALETVGISHLKDQPYTKISGGERQMVLIARSLAQQTEIILLDEPTSHLDYRNQFVVLKTIQRLAVENNLAVLITTHLPYYALAYPSKAALMLDGHFIACGDSREVITDENLTQIYNMGVRVLDVFDAETGKTYAMSVPLMDTV